MRRWLLPIGTFLVIVAAAGILVMVSGIIPIKASSGHWPITKWLLSFSMSRSVATHSAGIEPPANLRDAAQVMKGAGHFETGCAMCHGSPIWERPRVTRRLTPTPPSLKTKSSEWQPRELFYITKHGVMLTGMPAFPSQQRDDEVWAVVSFLLELPKIDEARYRELVFGSDVPDAENVPRIVSESCARCHGLDGHARETSAFPKLAGQQVEYLAASMQAYADGTRHSGMMEPIAARLNDDEIREIATFYNGQSRSASTPQDADDALDQAIERGRLIATAGIQKQNVGACSACHQADGSRHNPSYPTLTGQFADYLVLQLNLFQERRRGGANARIMHAIADGLESDQMRDVAVYYESLAVSPR